MRSYGENIREIPTLNRKNWYYNSNAIIKLQLFNSFEG